VVSDDGRRVFFHSTDALLARASNGRQNVFEYTDGKTSLISPGDGPSPATFLDASASGDDVFFLTNDELVPNPNGGDDAVYDARVGGGFAVSPREECAGTGCRPSASLAPSLPTAASLAFSGEGNAGNTSARPVTTSKVTVSRPRTITGTVGSLKVKVSARGRLTVSGSGLMTRRSSLSKAQTVAVRLALTSKAAKTLRKKRSLTTKVKVVFTATGGRASTATFSVTFKSKAGSARR
jgi:hypothetical protein